jgi:hypothetical protein
MQIKIVTNILNRSFENAAQLNFDNDSKKSTFDLGGNEGESKFW